MRVLLIWPCTPDAVLNESLSCCEPLPFEYLAGALRSNHDVVVHDARLDGPLEQRAKEPAPGLIGLAIPYTSALASVHELAQQTKQIWPDVPIVIGGHHPTVSRDWLDGIPADYIIVGEGSQTLSHLVDSLDRGGCVQSVPGLAPFRHRVFGVPAPRLHSLDELPLPDRSVTKAHRQHYFHSLYRPVALIRFSAGCPYNCTFCVLWKLTNRRYLTKHISRILTELKQIDVENVYVVDDEAFIQPARMLELADAISRAGIAKRYHMYVRADTAVRHRDAIERWAEIGLDSVLIGAESMNGEELLDYQKGAEVSDTLEAMTLFHSLQVKVRANFIVRPEYSDEDFDRLIDTVGMLNVDMPSFAVLTPLPGTVLFDQHRNELTSNDPALFDCYHALLKTRLPLSRFYDRLASLLESAAGRIHGPGESHPSVFYFSNDDAFQRMVATIRSGHRRYGGPEALSA
jgi:methyltransferase